MNILMAASECVPLVKIGGLADVVGTLPQFLRAEGHDVRVIIPKYRKIDDAKFNLKPLPYKLLIPMGANFEEATIKQGTLAGGVPVYCIESRRYFDRAEVYGTADGDYADNRERFVFFSRAVLEAAKAVGFQPDVIHCHDWQTGIIPAYLKTVFSIDGFYCRTATVYTIHNIAYQGMFDADTVRIAGFSMSDFVWNRLEFYGKFNFMKVGLVYADMLSTVSPTYAKEILTDEGGRGMAGILRSRTADTAGILNGIDYDEWNPASDPQIAAPFTGDRPEGKKACKADLQKACGLPVKPDAMVFGSVSRLDPQKGFDLILKTLPKLFTKNVQVVTLGSGDRRIQESLTDMAKRYPGKMHAHFTFNNPLAHKIYAGADAFLMPSLFEPCGLGQMIALTYGTIPVVNKTGGLADTIFNFNLKDKKGNGFVFTPPLAGQFALALERAEKAFRNEKSWHKLMQNAFHSDFSWNRAVKGYAGLYEKASAKRTAGK
jgi:starch synthase